MSKIKLTGSNSGYVEIDSAADAGNLTLTLPTSGVRLLSNTDNVFSGITTTAELDINGKIDVSTDAVIARNLSVGGITTHTGTTTLSDDVTFTGASYNLLWDKSDNQLEFGDNAKLSFGASSDLQIFHDGSNDNILSSGTGSLLIKGDAINLGSASGEYYVRAFENADVQIRYNNSTKIQTTNTGAVVTGICTATSFSGSGENLTRTTPYSHRNVVINGGMQIAQRGTSSTGNTSGGYKTCDRWELSLNSAGTWTVTQSGTCPDGFNNSIKLDCTTANTSLSSNSFLSIRTAFEGRDLRRFAKGTTSAKAMTVSFYVKTNKNGTYAVELYDVDNTKIATSLYTVSNSNWNRYEFTIPASTNTGQFNNDNNKSMNLGFILAAGTNYTNGTQYGFFVQGSNLNRAAGHTVNLADSTSNEFHLTGVQLEEGEIATPFEHRSDGDTLMDCYRYYVKIFTNTSDYPFGYGYKYSNTAHAVSVQLPTRLRGTPTCTFSGLRIRGGDTGGVNNAETVTSLGGMSYSNANFQSFTVNTNVNSASVGQTVVLVNSVSNNTTYINFDAEL
jgi:hypothetical protein